MTTPTIEFPGNRARVRLKMAEPVVVVHGALAGMRGTIAGIGTNQYCLVRLDETQRGVLLAIPAAALAARAGFRSNA